jgi:Histidine kinase
MSRTWIWIQLLIGWLPIWALFTVLMMAAHSTSFRDAAPIALRLITAAALLGIGVYRLAARLPWPHPFRLRFVAMHILAAGIFSVSWVALNSLIESSLRWQLVVALGPGLVPYLITGVWMYVMVAGVAYATRAAERSAQMATLEARTQLAALRSQLHPHFLFNALHTVVQLIPMDPKAAVRAAELLSEALRIAIEEQRDQVPLSDEWAFVQRYLAIESLRFGERLRLHVAIDDAALRGVLPSFALQTLVENAVRHAAAPRVEPTELKVCASVTNQVLLLSVVDDGAGAKTQDIEQGAGTGLRRLRERLAWLYGTEARLVLSNLSTGGFSAMLSIPQAKANALIDSGAG